MLSADEKCAFMRSTELFADVPALEVPTRQARQERNDRCQNDEGETQTVDPQEVFDRESFAGNPRSAFDVMQCAVLAAEDAKGAIGTA